MVAWAVLAGLLLGGMGLGAWRLIWREPLPEPVALGHAIPPRDTQADPNLIDLTDHYNVELGETWQDVWGQQNHLGELPVGISQFAGTSFDVRGLIQVEEGSARYPSGVEGIAVGRVCRRLHFLHAATNAGLIGNGTEIGRYLVHYTDGEQVEIPIILGQDLLDWWNHPEDQNSPVVVAWRGENPKSRREGKRIYLFKRTWSNPRPETAVATIDLSASRPGPSPFLVALTVE
jgi:hypothetical protein